MKRTIKKVLAVLFAVIIITSLFTVVFASAKSADGYVTVSFEDFGQRVRKEIDEGYVDFIKPMGVIVPETKVEYYKGENIADITLRLLKKLNMTSEYSGSASSGFYLSSIGNFSNKNYGTVSSFGEFDAGPSSGWMVTFNNRFIDRSASEIKAENGDYICWKYSCSIGADIGCDWSNQSAKISGFNFTPDTLTLSPAFSKSVKNYDLRAPEGTRSVQVEALMENYWSEVTYKSGSKTYKYKSDIPVSNGTVIVIESKFIPMVGQSASDTDKITLTVRIGEDSSIRLNKESLKLNYKKSETLTAQLTGSEKVSWSSSDTSVAVVDENGKVTAAGKGTAVITAKNEKGDTAQCQVKVTYSFVQWIIIIVLFGWIWY